MANAQEKVCPLLFPEGSKGPCGHDSHPGTFLEQFQCDGLLALPAAIFTGGGFVPATSVNHHPGKTKKYRDGAWDSQFE
jgi:hypothetical protein